MCTRPFGVTRFGAAWFSKINDGMLLRVLVFLCVLVLLVFELVVPVSSAVLFPGFPEFMSDSNSVEMVPSSHLVGVASSDGKTEGLFVVHDGGKESFLHWVAHGLDASTHTLVVFAHGNVGSLGATWSQTAATLSASLGEGTAVLTFDYRGYGLSPSRSNPRNAVSDMSQLLVAAAALNHERLVVCGHSIGAAVAVNAVSVIQNVVDIASLVLIAPMLGTRNLKWHVPFSRLCGEKFDCRLAMAKTRRLPLTLLLAEHDTIIDNDAVLSIVVDSRSANNMDNVVSILVPTTHNNVWNHPEYISKFL